VPGRVTLKAINAELERRGHRGVLAKGDGYFYFTSGEAADWLDKTVNVPTLNSLTMEEWVNEFARLQKLNAEIMQGAAKPGPTRSRVRGRRRRGEHPA
jgi:protein involved in ribonucleotide reduction